MSSAVHRGAECEVFSDDEVAAVRVGVYGALVVVLMGALVIVCEDFFFPCLVRVSRKWRLPDDIAGATLLAATTSSPELFSTVLDTFHYHNSIGVGTVVGSAVFNLLVLVGASGLVHSRPLPLDPFPIVRDTAFSAALVGLFWWSLLDGWLEWYECAAMVLWYAVYCVSLLLGHASRAEWKPLASGDGGEADDQDGVGCEGEEEERGGGEGGGGEGVAGVAPRESAQQGMDDRLPIRITALHLPPLSTHPSPPPLLPRPLRYAAHVVFAPIRAVVALTIPNPATPLWHHRLAWPTLVSLAWVGALSTGLVACCTRIGCGVGVAPARVGVTVLAVATSLPDCLSSIAAARRGQGSMAVGNAFGSNLFNFSIALAVPCLVQTAVVAPGSKIAVGVQHIAEPVVVLAGSLAVTSVGLAFEGWELNSRIGGVLVFLYVAFVAFVFVAPHQDVF